ncbi:MAG: methyltransferase [Deltaproteobacteria bacterium]|nr:methyltransferase [Deltaproteobacteria bacterium]MBN2672279.1 methyltransferase [Deltaproteobacteria bacterium]
MNNTQKYSSEELTPDTLFEGKVVLYQPKKGYRFSVDAPLLTWFSCVEKPIQYCADLGCGCGVIGISLLVAQQVKNVVAIEIQPKLAALSEYNAIANGVATQFTSIHASVTAPHAQLPEKKFELVVSNPPFWPSDNGRLPPDEERRIARHEISITVDEVVQSAKRLLHPKKGRFCIAFPAMRLETLLKSISNAGLNATRAVFIHPHINSIAELVLLEARCGRSGQLKIAPPLYLKDAQGNNSADATEILSGRFCPPLQRIEDIRTATR